VTSLDEWKKAYPGWADLLEELRGYNFQKISVKEKFGGLRVYLYYADTAAWDKAAEIEIRSEEVCEVCGNPGRILEDRGWLVARCETCLPGGGKDG
jgi:hypothetical protein